MIEKLNEILVVVSSISESIKPNLGFSIVNMLAPIFSSFLAVMIAYWLDRRMEGKKGSHNLLDNINYLLVKNDLNIRTLFAIVRNVKSIKVGEDIAGTRVRIPELKVFSPLLEIEISELKLVDIDNIMTNLIFAFRELNQILEDSIKNYNVHAKYLLEITKNGDITIHHFKKFNLLLDEIVKNSNAFIIRLIVLNTQLLMRAYDKFNLRTRKKLYEIEITDTHIDFIKCKLDHPDVKERYDVIATLKSKNQLAKTYKGMETKDALIRIFSQIIDNKNNT